MRFLMIVLMALLSVSSAYALSKQDAPNITPAIMPLPKVKGDAVPWQLFASTKEKQKKVTFPDGGYSFEVTPEFSDELKALDGKEITLYGFMFPLQQEAKHTNFLLGPYPPSCPFHYHASPSLIVEVKTSKPIPFSWDEMMLKGKLQLVEKDPNGVFYMLNDAKLEK